MQPARPLLPAHGGCGATVNPDIIEFPSHQPAHCTPCTIRLSYPNASVSIKAETVNARLDATGLPDAMPIGAREMEHAVISAGFQSPISDCTSALNRERDQFLRRVKARTARQEAILDAARSFGFQGEAPTITSSDVDGTFSRNNSVTLVLALHLGRSGRIGWEAILTTEREAMVSRESRYLLPEQVVQIVSNLMGERVGRKLSDLHAEVAEVLARWADQ